MLAAPSSNPCFTPWQILSSQISGLGAVIVTSTSLDSHRSNWVLAPSLSVITRTMLGMFTKTPGDLLMVKDEHLCGAHLVCPRDRL